MTPAARTETRKTSSVSSEINNVISSKKSSSASLYHRFF